MQLRELGAGTENPRQALRMLKTLETRLSQRIDAYDGRASPHRLLKRRQHARMIRPWILTNDDDALRVLEIMQCHCAFPGADRLAQRVAARLVAHVRAIRQIVRAEHTGQKLVEERRFITCASGSV